MTCPEISWLAGLLDAEGCFGVYQYSNGTRCLRIAIGMTHLKTMQKVSKILNTKIELRKPSGRAKSQSYNCRIQGARKVSRWSNILAPLLFTKQEQCILLGEMASIIMKHVTNPGYFYTPEDRIILDSNKARVVVLNAKGIEKSSRQLIPHNFSLEWLAGVLDGDGSIFTSKCKRAHTNKFYYRPVVKIGMNDKSTINYLSNWFGVDTKVNNKKTKKKATNYSLRLLSTKILDFMPEISKHLITKQEQGKLIVEYANLKRQGGVDTDRLAEIKERIYGLNHSWKYSS